MVTWAQYRRQSLASFRGHLASDTLGKPGPHPLTGAIPPGADAAWAHSSVPSNRYLDRFSLFWGAHKRDQQTIHATPSVGLATVRILCTEYMRCGLIIIIIIIITFVSCIFTLFITYIQRF